MSDCKKNEIRVNVNYRGLWHLPFVGKKKTEIFRYPPGSTVESLMKSLISKYGEDFKKISGFCNPIIDGRLITPYERDATELKDGQWVSFVFGVDGG
jgi:molybdopterin converting factor small subunit